MSTDDTSKRPAHTRFTRREFLVRVGKLGLGTAGASLFAACSQTPPATTSAPGATVGTAPQAGATTISMLGWGSPLEKQNVDNGLKLFQERNPGITVQWLHTPQDYPTKLKTMLAGGNPPDVSSGPIMSGTTWHAMWSRM